VKCTTVALPGGGRAILCGRERISTCVKCGAIAGLLCDWKLSARKTCDAPLCDACASSPAQNKHLCPAHAKAWEQHPGNAQRKLAL
jgi:hypothetical protein